MLLAGVFHVARGAAGGSAQKVLDHLPANHDWMPMLTLVFGDDCPDLLVTAEKLVLEILNGFQRRSRTINQSDNCGIASPVQDSLKPGLKGTELAIFRMRVP